jgi:hypothetical protein
VASKSANVFGSFLSTVQNESGRPGKQAFDMAAEIINAARAGQLFASPSEPQPDAIPAIVRAVAGDGVPSTVISIAKSTGLTIDQTAAGLRNAEATGLLKHVAKDDVVSYELTSLGKNLL